MKDPLTSSQSHTLHPVEEDVLAQVRGVIQGARRSIRTSINTTMVEAYWEIGRHICEAVGERAAYGKQLLRYLSENLTAEFGKGFTVRELRRMRQFYLMFPIRGTLCPELSWSHYRLLMRISNDERRCFYAQEAATENWSVRQLDRQVNSFYFERLLSTQNETEKDIVRNEVQETQPLTSADDIIRDPYVLEFLDLKPNEAHLETNLENALIAKLTDFLLELGKGFCFVGRQKRISEGTHHYYIDLVFYNYLLKCFVLVDLKTGELTHQDVGQMDFYTRLYKQRFTPPGDNPPIGIILCSKKSEAVAKYSVLADKDNLFAAQYLLYLPSEEELAAALKQGRDEIEVEQLSLS